MGERYYFKKVFLQKNPLNVIEVLIKSDLEIPANQIKKLRDHCLPLLNGHENAIIKINKKVFRLL
jgi:hypothetical protein